MAGTCNESAGRNEEAGYGAATELRAAFFRLLQKLPVMLSIWFTPFGPHTWVPAKAALAVTHGDFVDFPRSERSRALEDSETESIGSLTSKIAPRVEESTP